MPWLAPESRDTGASLWLPQEQHTVTAEHTGSACTFHPSALLLGSISKKMSCQR